MSIVVTTSSAVSSMQITRINHRRSPAGITVYHKKRMINNTRTEEG